MFRILIVDDEPSVVDALAHTLPWTALDIDEVLVAYSAREALRQIERQHVDIIITDIRMPGMSGIELLQQIRTVNKHTRFILLTGHAEFQYAKEALHLQVVEYLLKPVRDETLVSVLRSITSDLREEWARISSQERTMNYLRDHLPMLRAELLRSFLEGRIGARELLDRSAILNVPFDKGDRVYSAIIRLEHHFTNAQDRFLFEYAVLNMAEEVLNQEFEIWTCKDVHDYQVLMIKPKLNGFESKGMETVSRILGQLQHLVLHYLNKNVSIVYGQCDEFPTGLRSSYEASLRTLRRWIGGDMGLLLSSNQSEEPAASFSLSLLQAPPSLSHLFEAGQWEEAVSRVELLFSALKATPETPIHADVLAEIYHTVLSACYHYAHISDQSIAQVLGCEEDYRFYQSAEISQSIAALYEWTLEVCRRLSSNSRHNIIDARAGLIKQVQEYIHVNLAVDVSLQTLASHIGMHPVYLSKVFKIETGEGLKDYLLRVRMERAIHLLTSSDMKVYEIANQVGYLNPASFIKTFKKEYGVTPQEYREQH